MLVKISKTRQNTLLKRKEETKIQQREKRERETACLKFHKYMNTKAF